MVFASAAEDHRRYINHEFGALVMEHLLAFFTLHELSLVSAPTAALAIHLVQLFEILLAHFVEQVTCCAFKLRLLLHTWKVVFLETAFN